tara:strand:- start:11808 stop:12731 length:924 start_codon:yes stop_codon:yes gene_type:complete
LRYFFVLISFLLISCSNFNSETKYKVPKQVSGDLTNYFLEKGEIDSAKIQVDDVYNKNPSNLENLIKRGEVYFILKNYEVSEKSWLDCLENDNYNESCYNKLIALYCGVLKNNDTNCREFIKKALLINKKNKTALYFKGKNYLLKNKYSEAIEQFEEILKLDSNNLRTLNELAILYDTSYKSKMYYNKMIEIDSSFISFYGLGMYYQKNKKFNEAIESYKIAINIEEKKEAYYNIGYCFLLLNDFKVAQDYFSEAINLDPSYLEAYYARGFTYKKLKQINLAVEDLKFCLMLEPGNEEARIQLESLK